MKVQILNSQGSKAKEIETTLFDAKYREDIIQKIIESEKIMQEYAPFFLAGNQTSASGNIRKTRHSWKTSRGRGMSRIPRKRMSRRGDRFSWVGAVIPGTRGGRRAHPPKLGGRLGKINKKEFDLGLKSALGAVANVKLLKEKYSRLKEKEIKIKLPLVVESNVLELKTKEFFAFLKKVLEDAYVVALQDKSVRAGKGKARGRKYKKNAGMLLVIGDKEEKKIMGIDVRKVNDLDVGDLAEQGGRLVMFSENSLEDLENKFKKKEKSEKEVKEKKTKVKPKGKKTKVAQNA